MKGSELKSWREKNNWTQADLMQELDVHSRQTVVTWEKMERLPRLVELAVIAIDQIEVCRFTTGFEKQFSESEIANAGFSRLKSVAPLAAFGADQS